MIKRWKPTYDEAFWIILQSSVFKYEPTVYKGSKAVLDQVIRENRACRTYAEALAKFNAIKKVLRGKPIKVEGE